MRFSGRPFSIAALAVALLAPGRTSAASTPSCAPGDPVVWVNTSTKVYHEQGDQYYGNTKHGEYQCKSAADKAGDHLSKQTGGAKSSATHAPSNAKAAVPAATAAATGAMPAASPSSKHHKKSSASPAPGASALAAPAAAPSASPSGKSKKHKKSAASPAPSAT